MPNPSRIPRALQQLDRWCRWQLETPPGGKPTKRPLGSVRGRLLTFEQARAVAPVTNEAGLGFAFTGGVKLPTGEAIFALDLDGCVTPEGTIEGWAQEIVDAHDRSYTEVTPSGTGLRVWIAVRRPPKSLARTKVDVPFAAPPGVTKKPNVQVFGLPLAQYVTVTGEHLELSRPQMRIVENLDWLIERFELGESDDAPGQLPDGTGAVPSLAEVDRAVRAAAPQLVDGDWKPTVASRRDGSASEAYFVLVQHVLRASRGYGAVAVAFLLERTAWGRGEIEDSKDANRYTRETWVRNEVARVAGKKAPAPAADVFDDGFEMPQLMSERRPAPAADSDLLFRDLPDFLQGEDDAEFLVYNVLPAEGLAQFYGDPSSGKTPFVLSLAVHVAAGLPSWFGHKVDRHGTVVYMVGEGRQGLRKRLRAEARLHGLEPEKIDLRATKRPGRLTDEDDVARWIAAIEAAAPQGIALLVVDTQNANFGAGNENATEDMTLFVQHLKALSARLRCLVALTHHKGHGDKERGRGNTALWGALDADFDVTRREHVVQAAPRKCKDWEAQEPLVGVLQVVEVRRDAEDRPVTAVCLRTAPPDADEVFEAAAFDEDEQLRRVFVLVAALVQTEPETPVPASRIASVLGVPEKVARARLQRLEELGAIAADGKVNSSKGRVFRLLELGEELAKRVNSEVENQALRL